MMGKLIHAAVFVAAIGAINWGLVGALDMDLVKMLAEAVSMPHLMKPLYMLIGAAGVVALVHAVQEMM